MTRPYDELRTDIAAWVECRKENQELHLAFLRQSSSNVAADGGTDSAAHLREIEVTEAKIRAYDRWTETADEVAEITRQRDIKEEKILVLRNWKKAVIGQLGLTKLSSLPNGACEAVLQLQNRIRGNAAAAIELRELRDKLAALLDGAS